MFFVIFMRKYSYCGTCLAGEESRSTLDGTQIDHSGQTTAHDTHLALTINI